MDRTKKSLNIEQNVAWTSADRFYDIIQELHMDMLECRKGRDVWGMLDTLNDLYILVYPYISRYMKEDNKTVLESNEDVSKEMGQYTGENTDFSSLNSSKHIMNAIKLVNDKRLILSKLMAKAQLNIPLKPKDDDRPAALATDDW